MGLFVFVSVLLGRGAICAGTEGTAVLLAPDTAQAVVAPVGVSLVMTAYEAKQYKLLNILFGLLDF